MTDEPFRSTVFQCFFCQTSILFGVFGCCILLLVWRRNGPTLPWWSQPQSQSQYPPIYQAGILPWPRYTRVAILGPAETVAEFRTLSRFWIAWIRINWQRFLNLTDIWVVRWMIGDNGGYWLKYTFCVHICTPFFKRSSSHCRVFYYIFFSFRLNSDPMIFSYANRSTLYSCQWVSQSVSGS